MAVPTLVADKKSATGYKSVTIEVDADDENVYACVQGKYPDGLFADIRSGSLNSNETGDKNLVGTFDVPAIIHNGDIYVFKEIKVFADGPVTLTYQER